LIGFFIRSFEVLSNLVNEPQLIAAFRLRAAVAHCPLDNSIRCYPAGDDSGRDRCFEVEASAALPTGDREPLIKVAEKKRRKERKKKKKKKKEKRKELHNPS